MTPPAVRHYVYRCYDDFGVLLYVGCTAHVKPRLSQHRNAGAHSANASRWLRATQARIEVEGPYPNKRAGRDAESNAIYDEQPLFNIQGRGKSSAFIFARVVDYLFNRGHHELAIETTCNCGANDDPEWVCYAHDVLALARAG